MTAKRRNYNQKSPEVERQIVDWNTEGVPIPEMVKRLKEMGEPLSRQTIYNILGRFGIKRTQADLRFKLIREDTLKLNRLMLKYVNGTADKPAVIAAMSEFEARWAQDN